jgi:hypothetical protein
MSQSHFKSDSCYQHQQQSVNKNIFNYITDTTMFQNNNECLDTTPPFLAYIPRGVQQQNVDIESELLGLKYIQSKCGETRYQGAAPLASDGLSNVMPNMSPHNRQLCTSNTQIIPNGYTSIQK